MEKLIKENRAKITVDNAIKTNRADSGFRNWLRNQKLNKNPYQKKIKKFKEEEEEIQN